MHSMDNSPHCFSVCTSIYKNDNPEYVQLALDSMIVYQSIKPSEIVIVQDGPVSSSLSDLIRAYDNCYPGLFQIIRFDVNQGLGNALRAGVESAKYEYVARMDSDDICLPDRFEKQLSFLDNNPNVDIVGGQISEFVDSPSNIIGKRIVPLKNEEIYQFMKSRCALNHVTVMFRKQSVLQSGNYQDWYWNEDYFLWVRMMLNHCVFANLPDILVNVRSGIDQYGRRGGRPYFKSEIGIKKLMRDNHLISTPQYCVQVLERYVLQILLPAKIRGWILRTFTRK